VGVSGRFSLAKVNFQRRKEEEDTAMAMNLYAINEFRVSNGAVINEPKQLVAGFAVRLMTKDDAMVEKILGLSEGQSEVISYEQDGIMVKRGARFTRLPDFRMNRVVWDSHAKEYVMVSNGECVRDHSSEHFRESHPNNAPCEYAPSEGIALRPVLSNGKVMLAWTYRGLNPCDLESVSNEAEIKAEFDAVLSKRRSARFIGRI
jgi:hypothetical protein